ncbi:MAG: 2'-5' RNA ligase family protein [Reyranella sp.]|uniref:2'-5' RNA ligase family protein n=1 Tax=Reyranella sp. TaxID=1929291 RepID=UPI002731CEE5|nr:2'-5' RNA ligase family protein [Reyranella sp.]MDP1962340.1 2'-5' RNA ligase family protein [Reyranella sp.]MDP2376529.1 2'-5' RNA ligase family protein [Reyranella sp.]
MLYVVAWPVLAEADDTALRRLRAQYHPREAGLIGPHFTLVFGATPDREAALRATLGSIGQRPFWFMIDRIVRSDLYLYAEPSDGAAELTGLHETLNPAPGGEPFKPHITLGLFPRAAEAEQVARIVERQHLPMTGRIEELALLRRESERLDTLATHRLAA